VPVRRGTSRPQQRASSHLSGRSRQLADVNGQPGLQPEVHHEAPVRSHQTSRPGSNYISDQRLCPVVRDQSVFSSSGTSRPSEKSARICSTCGPTGGSSVIGGGPTASGSTTAKNALEESRSVIDGFVFALPDDDGDAVVRYSHCPVADKRGSDASSQPQTRRADPGLLAS